MYTYTLHYEFIKSAIMIIILLSNHKYLDLFLYNMNY